MSKAFARMRPPGTFTAQLQGRSLVSSSREKKSFGKKRTMAAATACRFRRMGIQGFEKGPTKRHGCPSHGIGLTPDENELWLTDAHNSRLHIFDATVMPPKPITSIALRDQPGWVTFSLDGRFAYPSTGDVIEVATRQIVTGLKDEHGADVQSEKMVEIDFQEGRPIRAGDQ